MKAPSLKLLAAFGAGIAAWEAVVHASLLLNRQSPRLFGIRLAPRLNVVQSVVPAVAAIGLARYALARDDRPPFAFRWLPGRPLRAGPEDGRAARGATPQDRDSRGGRDALRLSLRRTRFGAARRAVGHGRTEDVTDAVI